MASFINGIVRAARGWIPLATIVAVRQALDNRRSACANGGWGLNV